jgi:copper oxidase (laccase) domain-containing protein
VEEAHARLPDGRGVELRSTDRDDGDLRVDGQADDLGRRRAAIVDRPWVWLRQVHGAEVVSFGPEDDPAAVAGTEADAVVTRRDDVALAVHGADCGIVGLWSPEGVIGAAHAGWRGLLAGVVGATIDRMAEMGASRVRAVTGPCIGPCCYEFTGPELAELEERFGPRVVGRTSAGSPALDLPQALAAAFEGSIPAVALVAPRCTGCGRSVGTRPLPDPLDAPQHWSHRARGEVGRQAMVVWISERPAAVPQAPIEPRIR